VMLLRPSVMILRLLIEDTETVSDDSETVK
jgi:hypothetical protein